MKKILFFLILILSIGFGNVKTTLPKLANDYIPIIYEEQQRLWKDFKYVFFLYGQVEQETCYSMTHKKCWNPKVYFRGMRNGVVVEFGGGLPQATMAARAVRLPNGRFVQKIRFDALSDLKISYPRELSELTWNNLANRPRLQIVFLILKNKQNWELTRKYAVDDFNGIMFMLASYNGGVGGLRSEIKRCMKTRGCNSGVWFGNVERVVMKSQKVLWGNKSPYQINREYVFNITRVRVEKYIQNHLSRDNDYEYVSEK